VGAERQRSEANTLAERMRFRSLRENTLFPVPSMKSALARRTNGWPQTIPRIGPIFPRRRSVAESDVNAQAQRVFEAAKETLTSRVSSKSSMVRSTPGR
jgi:hypothetical protein